MNLNREMRKMTHEQRIEFLVSKGMSRDAAEDWATSMQISQKRVEKAVDRTPFSQSQAFKDIKARVEKLRGGKSELQRSIPIKEPGLEI